MTRTNDDIIHSVPSALLGRATGGSMPRFTDGGGGGGSSTPANLGQYLGQSLLHLQATPERNCTRPQVQPIADKRGIPADLSIARLVGGANALVPTFGCFHTMKLQPGH